MFVAGDFNARPSEKFGPVLLAKESVRAGNTSSLSIPRHYGLINYSQLVKKNNQVRRLVIYLLNVYYEIWDIDGCAIARAQRAVWIIFYMRIRWQPLLQLYFNSSAPCSIPYNIIRHIYL